MYIDFYGSNLNCASDVTKIVNTLLNSAPVGINNVPYSFKHPESIQGAVLIVIFNLAVTSIVIPTSINIVFGGLSDTISFQDSIPIVLTKPFSPTTDSIFLSLGITSAKGSQPSEIRVNGKLMTSTAGGNNSSNDAFSFSIGCFDSKKTDVNTDMCTLTTLIPENTNNFLIETNSISSRQSMPQNIFVAIIVTEDNIANVNSNSNINDKKNDVVHLTSDFSLYPSLVISLLSLQNTASIGTVVQIKAIVTDFTTSKPVPNVNVTFTRNGRLFDVSVSDENGEASSVLIGYFPGFCVIVASVQDLNSPWKGATIVSNIATVEYITKVDESTAESANVTTRAQSDVPMHKDKA